eukprot:jgi/Ulvmu1/9327/UM050_0077.1
MYEGDYSQSAMLLCSKSILWHADTGKVGAITAQGNPFTQNSLPWGVARTHRARTVHHATCTPGDAASQGLQRMSLKKVVNYHDLLIESSPTPCRLLYHIIAGGHSKQCLNPLPQPAVACNCDVALWYVDVSRQSRHDFGCAGSSLPYSDSRRTVPIDRRAGSVHHELFGMRIHSGAVTLFRGVQRLNCSGWTSNVYCLIWPHADRDCLMTRRCATMVSSRKVQAKYNAASGSAQSVRSIPFAPDISPVKEEDLEKLVRFFIEHRNILVIAGAGCSTESGIPDYRGPGGAYTRDGYKPMTHQKFMSNDANRSRYWARSFAGWMDYAHKEPNGSHVGLHRLRMRNWVSNIITQNVDRLQHACGTPNVLEIHGTNHETRCTTCQWATSRTHVQQMLKELNPGAEELFRASTSTGDITQTLHGASHKPSAPKRPDGDVELPGSGEGFRFPDCPQCGGILKPDVVYFGDNVPQHKALWAAKMAQECDAMLLLGTSCTTLSVFRLVKAVHERGGEVAAVNVGPTRADALLSFSVAARIGEVLMRLATHDALLLQRPPR